MLRTPSVSGTNEVHLHLSISKVRGDRSQLGMSQALG